MDTTTTTAERAVPWNKGKLESGKRDSQDGSRLVYVLTQIAKVLELTDIERRLITLDAKANGELPAPDREG
jgi:hypothetical protein